MDDRLGYTQGRLYDSDMERDEKVTRSAAGQGQRRLIQCHDDCEMPVTGLGYARLDQKPVTDTALALMHFMETMLGASRSFSMFSCDRAHPGLLLASFQLLINDSGSSPASAARSPAVTGQYIGRAVCCRRPLMYTEGTRATVATLSS